MIPTPGVPVSVRGIRNGLPIELRRPDGTVLQTVVANVPMLCSTTIISPHGVGKNNRRCTDILGTTGDDLQLTALVEFLAQPGHGPVEVMEGKVLGTGYPIVLAPDLRGPVAPRVNQPVEDCQVDGAFDIELELASDQRLTEHGLDTALHPEAPEDEIGSDGKELRGLGATRGMGIEDGELVGKAQAGAEERIELAGSLKQIEATEGGEDALADLAVDA